MPPDDDTTASNIFLVLTGFLLAVFLRNLLVAAIYLRTDNVKKKFLLYILFASQLLGPIAVISFIIAQLDPSASCPVILRITTATSGISLSLLLTGIFGIKAYRCSDDNRLVLAALVVLSTAATAVLFLDVITLRSLRSLSGLCIRPSPGLSPVFLIILLTESSFVCACFCYVFWKSHGPVVVRGRISVHLSFDDHTHSHPSASRKERGRSDGAPPAAQPLSRDPSMTSILHNDLERIHTYNTAETAQSAKSPITFPSAAHSRPPLRPSTIRMSPADFPLRAPTSRPTSPVRSSMSHFTRYIPRMSLFREAMRYELCYTAVITAFTVVSVAMTLVGVKSAGGMNTTIWVTVDWALVSLLVIRSFGRVIRRHDNESLLLHSSSWYHDLHTDRTTAELLGDAPQPVRTPRMLFKACAHRSAARHNVNGGAPDLSTCRLFPSSAYSSRGDLHSSAASTSGTSNTYPPVETGPHEGHVSTEDLPRPPRSKKGWFKKKLLGTPPTLV